jgi:hypothetical protein
MSPNIADRHRSALGSKRQTTHGIVFDWQQWPYPRWDPRPVKGGLMYGPSIIYIRF